MRKLLNTLFVTSENAYLSLDGENVVASRDGQEAARYPLHMLSGILSFSYAGASPALMGACAKRGVSLAFCTPGGRFLARVGGEGGGSVGMPINVTYGGKRTIGTATKGTSGAIEFTPAT